MADPDDCGRRGSPSEVLAVFFRLGLTCFGGPAAHLGYFRTEFVERRRWLDEAGYAALIALCQALPGPASSQAGFGIGLRRAGLVGGLAAWVGFTLPSALLMLIFAVAADHAGITAPGAGILHGLKLVAVAIVAQAVRGMAASLCPDRPRAGIAALALVLAVAAPGSSGQIATLLAGAALGLALCRDGPGPVILAPAPVSPRLGLACLALFLGLLALSLVPAPPVLARFGAFYRAGALVFGGGHVVLPLLRAAVVAPGWVSDADFLAGYGLAQALPGPLFTLAAYLGAVAGGPGGGILALISIFLPGLLLVAGMLPFWNRFGTGIAAQAALRGINAAVVGVLAAALYDPVWTGAVHSRADFAVAVLGFLLLTVWRAPPLAVVALCSLAGAACL